MSKPDLSEVVNPGSQAEQALIQLGKIAFWDTQIGSSGQSGATGMACASCHFHAGADTRSTNMVNPGLNKVVDDPMGDIVGLHNAGPSPDESFQTRHPNETLTASQQNRAVSFYSDPAAAQTIRQSDRAGDERFWEAYRNYEERAEAICR